LSLLSHVCDDVKINEEITRMLIIGMCLCLEE